MRITLTYRGPVPPKRSRGVSHVKADLRRAFHPQIKAQVEPMVDDHTRSFLMADVDGQAFLSPASLPFKTAVELDITMLTRPSDGPAGDADNRLKTLVDGLTRPANVQQLKGHSEPPEGGPTYCLMDDDNLVQGLNLHLGGWHDPSAKRNDALVVIVARLVLHDSADLRSPATNLFWLL